ncbi:MAG: hypothetical protein HRT40_12975 [Campylobacteraceae bacterium]|nr:hypothetical protein [Campylobacteraceae bacterium]
MKSEDIEQYKKKFITCQSYNLKLRLLIEDLLDHNEVKYHLVESRTKSIQDFTENVSRPVKNYLNPLTELSGVTIIVYYNDDVNKVATLIKNEFEEIEFEYKHQASNYEVSNFGYLSLHYILKLKTPRIKIFEWGQFKNLQSEIQIRTPLQHEWTTLSHAMQHKREENVPKQIRRKLYRLDGLSELADEELLAIKDQSESNIESTNKDIQLGKTNIPISPLSLRTFIESWDRLPEIHKFMDSLSYTFASDDEESDEESMDYYGSISMHCERIGLMTINELENSLNFNYKYFIIHANKESGSNWIVSNSFLLYLLLIKAHIHKFSVEILVNDGWYFRLAKHITTLASNEKNK